jgi:hypothetical protein
MTTTLNAQYGDTFPSWTTSLRPISPTISQTGYNSTLGSLETWNGTSWIVTYNNYSSPSNPEDILFSQNGTSFTSTPRFTYDVKTLSGLASETFTGIPSWAKRITVMFNVTPSVSGADMVTQVGAGSTATTGYITTYGFFGTSNNCAAAIRTSDFYLINSGATFVGTLVLTYIGSDTWIASGIASYTSATQTNTCSGKVTLTTGSLDRVVITPSTGVLTSGKIAIAYE